MLANTTQDVVLVRTIRNPLKLLHSSALPEDARTYRLNTWQIDKDGMLAIDDCMQREDTTHHGSNWL